MFYWLPIGVSFILGLIFTPIIKRFALKRNIVDLPAPRKIHQKPIPLLGGLAIFLSFSLSVIVFWSAGYIEDIRISSFQILAILVGAFILMIGGYLDDKYGLKPVRQFIWPTIAIVLILIAGVKVQYITNPLGGVLAFPDWLGVILAFLWLLGMIYTTKFLDGLDGLVAGVTTIGAIIIFIVSLYWDIPLSGTSILALILAGACLSFLIFNV